LGFAFRAESLAHSMAAWAADTLNDISEQALALPSHRGEAPPHRSLLALPMDHTLGHDWAVGITWQHGVKVLPSGRA
jgi:hypothetical protein